MKIWKRYRDGALVMQHINPSLDEIFEAILLIC
jgi:hypothetical protein